VLSVPAPTLEHEDAGGGAAALEKATTVRVAPVAVSGTVLGPAQLKTFGFFAYRQMTAGAAREVWDEGDKEWKADPAPGVAGVTPGPLAYKEGAASPWEAILVPAGAKDAAGQPQYAKAMGGYPQYSFRAWFESKEGGESGLSASSPSLSFVGAADRNLAVLGPGEDEKPESATEARLVLKNPALQVIGMVVIEREGSGSRLSLSNVAGASVVLHTDGHIELRPAGGQKVVVASDLETERITYRPAAGGPKQTLP
jgi:hypothetical protein